MNTQVSVDISVLIKEYEILQKAYETLKNNLEYEQRLRINAEQELLLLKEKMKSEYKRKRSKKEKEIELKERAERQFRGTTSDGRPLPKAAQWIESYEEFEAIRKWLFEESAKNPIMRARNRYAWSLGCAIGIRCGDLVQLKWGHLFNYDGTFKDKIIIVEQKTGKYISMLITEAVKVFTKEYLDYSGITPVLSEEIFKTQKGNGSITSTRSTYSKLFKAAGIACGIPRQISSHAMRHSFATIAYCIGSKKDLLKNLHDGLYLASIAVGHSTEKITSRYIGLDAYVKDAARQIVSDFLLGKSDRILEIPIDINTGDCAIQFKKDFATINKCLNNTNIN